MYRREVGQHATQPTFVDVRHPHAGGLFLNGLLSLFLGANEQQRAAVGHGFLNEFVSNIDVSDGLLQIENVNAGTVGQNKPLHLGVPATGLMPEMYAAFQKLAHGNDCHVASFFQLWDTATPARAALRGRLRPISVNAWCPLAFPTPQGPGGLRSSQLS